MKIIYEKNKIPGISYVIARNGLELPVIDITHPSFKVNPDEKELKELEQKLINDGEKSRKIPPLLRKIIVFFLLRRSYLGRGIMSSANTFTTGMTIYLLKLGAENLGSYATFMDKNIAGGLAGLGIRMRLQDMANLLAEGLKPLLIKKPSLPLHFINIGGGPSMDTLNTLILLNKEVPVNLKREIKIHLLDLDTDGSDFAMNSLKALQSTGGALEGLKADMVIRKHDWNNFVKLESYLIENLPDNSVVAVSSEGGIFDYCTDEVLFSIMRSIYKGTPEDVFMAGTLSIRDNISRRYNMFPSSSIERDFNEFSEAISKQGWKVEKHLFEPFNISIGMKKMVY